MTNKLRQFTWLSLGLCFAILYSCPVKKFLIVHFDKVNVPVSASSHFDKNSSSRNTKIAYLNRNNFSYKILGSAASVKPPFIPDWTPFLSTLLLLLGLSPLFVKLRALAKTANRNATEGSTPLYLQLLRLQI